MSLEPKVIQVPGIPGNLREQSLDEFLAVLEPTHLARQQLNEIRNQALKSVELSTQLMQANEKVIELQGKLMASYKPIGKPFIWTQDPLGPEPAPPPNITVNVESPPLPVNVAPADARSGPAPKAECPHCKKMITTSPGGWSSHQRNAHPDNQAPRPTV